ncbi:hypothetical protein F0P96_03045 [Hymenobacter busanensis]|uniref:Uncharacterized protein n=1 Tax=Hymenobacter busanensis TaxID=2607656 RepID=A0A7L4ZU17_9BACT|nr:hypothetical protein [Hymenobacter busanensis]KAA9339604.1 hypothetical protein F0P96_03045 [Hymenobacter busanensis]QHJ06641.1 hypothetical protein GUY19_04710 [Hymenobacter busanensis]
MATPLNLNTEGTTNDENERIKRDQKGPKRDEQQEQERDFQQIVNNNTDVDKDPTAYRSAGAHGYSQRAGQKDDLRNLRITGDETTPQGGNSQSTAGQGAGFENEGSYEKDMDLRTREQKFGEAAPSGEPKTPRD